MAMRKLTALALVCAIRCLGEPGAVEFFETRVRPVLANKCYSCHTASKLGGLRLDSRAAILEGGKSGPAVIPGKPSESLLIRAVRHADEKLKMPMAGEKLSPAEVEDLAHWIQSGASWPETRAAAPVKKGFAISPEQRAFWSFQPLRKPARPAVGNASWVKSPIDSFILAKLESQGLKPVKPASKRVLLRRASYDLIGLPPTPEQVDAFLADSSPDAFAKAVDRLLASPHYGERWGRHWLDVARYADGDGRPDKRPVFIGYGMARDGYVNNWRYRDWVVDALNRDMPYNQFVKAQIAADLMPQQTELPALGFFGLGPWFTGDDTIFVEARANERDDRIDALTKGFLGLTVTCARCHDHKYDPISQKDYTALAGVFWSSGFHEYNLAPAGEVAKYKEHWRRIKTLQAAIQTEMNANFMLAAEALGGQTARYMMAVRAKSSEGLDSDLYERWSKYLSEPAKRQHSFLKEWDSLAARGAPEAEAKNAADEFQKLVLSVIADKKSIQAQNEEMRKDYKPDPNEATVVLPGDLMQFEFFQYKQLLVQKVVDTQKFYVWLDVVQGEPGSPDYPRKEAVFDYPADKLERFLPAERKARLDALKADLAALAGSLPPEHPYLMGLADNAKPANLKVHLRGSPHALGEEVPRGFPAVLAGAESDPKPFSRGSGRLELAEAIAAHPLAARVIANRVWMHHFGRGIVATPANFGVTGERPTHPELLDYLSARLVEQGWSLKALHREIMLSSVYQLSAETAAANAAADPANALLWRVNLRRLDAESLRDTLLFAAGSLDERLGGGPQELNNAENKKRTLYGRVRRGGPDRMMTLFDFPDPNLSGDQRAATNVPLQGLFFLNSDLVWRQAVQLDQRLGAENDTARIHKAYRLLFGRQAAPAELQRGLKFLEQAKALSGAGATAWQQYAQVLLSSGELLYVN
jgi:hypothetical protein